MATSSSKVIILLRRLRDLTREGKVEWSKLRDSPTSFEYMSPSSGRVLLVSRDDDGLPPIDFVVYGRDGTVVSRVDWTSHRRSSGALTEIDSDILDLYGLAAQNLSGAAQVIDSLLEELPASDDDIPF